MSGMPQHLKTFDLACDWLLSPEIEGGYVNDPDDPGGETKHGISKRSYPDLDIANLTEDQARAIYFHDYWLKAGCSELPAPLGWALFGGVVNHKMHVAIALMQQSLGVTADGINGPVTQATALQSDVSAVLVDYLSRRARLYRDITLSNHTQSKYFRGWMRRLFLLQQAIYTHLGGSL
ncbi:peptidoglycan-binding protein [Sedimenticola selenatireducens]|uniref:Peptidoglycan-binding protein n=2 Tax=Sedimenticola selenatireducens TaxID=191960 RepID=A0A557S0D2_9GAMM|nr:peptidoglycan-binding protein [Sedimenticola selenatireducens]